MKRKLADNWKRIEQRIGDACQRADRDPADVKIVAVTKYASLDIVRALVDIGVSDLGESRVQELTKRAAAVNEWLGRRATVAEQAQNPRWHMVGHLQRNKIKALLPWVDMVHSVDSLRLAEDLDSISAKLDRVTPILLQLNITGQSTQHGVAVAAITHLVEQIQTLRHIEVRGLMAIGPLTENADESRYAFSRVRELYEEIIGLRICGPSFSELSLGMSNDFETAIEFGSTFVRIGSALLEGIEVSKEPLSAS